MKENFDEKALTWDNDPRRAERAKTVADELLMSIPDLHEKYGLDYGCGTGMLSFYLQPYMKHITLADTSEGMLSVLRKKIENAGVENMSPVMLDLSKNEYCKDKFDVIYSLMALHHIQDIDKLFGSFAQITNPSGYLGISDLDEEDGSFHNKDLEVHKGFNRDELSLNLKKHGFITVSWKICHEITKKIDDGTEKKYPMFLLIAQKQL